MCDEVKKINLNFQQISWIEIPSHEATLQRPQYNNTLIYALHTRWNDYGLVNNYFVYYCQKTTDKPLYMGSLKILKKGLPEGNYIISRDISKLLIENLSEDLISLGDEIYYNSLVNVLPDNCNDILKRMNDIAINEIDLTDFKSSYYWEHSLLRDNDSERMLRIAKDIIGRADYINNYKCKYRFNNVVFDFDYDIKSEFFSRRIYAIIGKNGVGKSTFLKTFLSDYGNKKPDLFEGNIPKYTIPILVSTSMFDSYDLANSDFTFEYRYCGVYDFENKKIKDEKDQIKTLLTECKLINEKSSPFNNLSFQTYSVLSALFSSNIVDTFMYKKTEENVGANYQINLDELENFYKTLSSGEKVLLYCSISIIANIRNDSLILIDEPETHLHPNAIETFLQSIYELVENFKSYAVLVTHSPLIIREMKADSVYILEREGETSNLRKPRRETLGANLTTLTDDIFGTRDIPLRYIKIIKYLKYYQGYSKEAISNFLQSEGYDINLSIRLFINSLD